MCSFWIDSGGNFSLQRDLVRNYGGLFQRTCTNGQAAEDSTKYSL